MFVDKAYLSVNDANNYFQEKLMEKLMKKVFFALVPIIVIAVLGAMTVACSKQEKLVSTEKTIVQFWGHINEAWNNSHREAIARFNASQNAIEVTASFFPYDIFEAKSRTSFEAGSQRADVLEIWGGWGLDFVSMGALQAVPDYLVSGLIEDCYEPVLGAFKGDDGHLYGIPVEYNIEYGGMLVNKKRFEDLGLKYPETWEEIIDTARKTTIYSQGIWTMRGFDFTTDDTLTTTFLSMILSLGGEYLVNGKFSFVTPEAEKALVTLVDYVKIDKLTNLDSATEALGPDIDGAHFIGMDEAMMVPRGPWAIAVIEEEYGKTYGVDFDYIKFPFYGTIRAFPAETGWSMCVPKGNEAGEAAWRYVEFFFEHDNLMQHNISCAQVPPRKSVVMDPNYALQMPYMAPLLDVLEYGRFIGPFNTDVLKFALRSTFLSLCSDDGRFASAREALAALENQLNTGLGLF